ncbi:hypothetical protein HGP17_25420 [Rhizobium sp. P38BS-XIX]|uniref:hypothetical protein n=1 Tax=Rhizobium sp. P38BS-XIX TaxID=2726740 RepID=UPI001456C4C4|nr:hypothetical protein [Rhizobium sp. P38BS-XIX]NLS00179.1 hypothetical protein [Rhizobium sp. P38BS-XIX]
MKTTGTNIKIDLDEDAGSQTETTIINEDGPIVLTGSNPDIIDEDANPLDKLPAHAKQNSDGSVTLPLYYPKTLTTQKGGQIRERKFEELTFHRLTGADQRAIAATSEEMMSVVAISRSTKLSQAVMNALYDKMDAADIGDAGRVLNHFLSNGPKTGR